MPLHNTKIVLGVTGGIAAYKSCELVRLFKKSGADVRVVMTEQAENFVGPLSFQSLSGHPVLRSLGEGYDLSATAHIDLSQWGDLLVVAPATANFLAKFAHGVCDDPLLTEALAFTGPILLAPAMNLRMWNASVTQENSKKLARRGVLFVGPTTGDLACGETGLGKMTEPLGILEAAERSLKPLSLKGVNVLVTSGPTRSYLDPVRFISNRSSGRMGHAIAQAAEERGADVTLVCGPVEEVYACLSRGKVIRVETNKEMLEQARAVLSQSDIIFGVAAVCDFQVEAPQKRKIKRGKALELELASAEDILGTLTKERKSGQVFVGFAAEMGNEREQVERAQRKLEEKGLDFIAVNDVSREDIGFGVDSNEVYLLERGKEYSFLPKMSKAEIASHVLNRVHTCWEQ